MGTWYFAHPTKSVKGIWKNKMSLFNELKRRNVFRVTAAYIVIAWLLIQVLELAADSFEAPLWVMKMLITVIVIGFVPTVLFSWAFELTPEGIKKDSEVDKANSDIAHTAKKLDYMTLVAAFGVAGMFVWQQLNPPVHSVPTNAVNQTATVNEVASSLNESDTEEVASRAISKSNNEKSIAVLPFVNMSSDAEQEYFADGISEEILNVLVRIPKLKVAGRTSSFSFKGKNQDLRVIGDALGVNHILEGSVRRSGTRLRITAQLIRSEDGFHLWSETYDRELEDIFDIQDEISQQVAEQLAISLGLNNKTNDQNRTDDLLVYENYLKANQLYLQRGKENLDSALLLLNEATTRDPNFAPAWTSLAFVYGVYAAYVTAEEASAKTAEWNALGRKAAQQALTLDPNSGEAYASLGTFLSYDFDFIKSFEQFDRALELSPDNPIVLDKVAQASLTVGYFQQVQALSERAIALDPLVAMYRNIQGVAQDFLGDYKKAIANYEKSIELNPTLPFAYYNLRLLYNNPSDIEKIIPLIRQALKHGAYTDETRALPPELLEFIANKPLLSDKKAVQKRMKNTNGFRRKYFLINYLKDSDALVELLEKNSWTEPDRTDINIFHRGFSDLYSNKGWKKQVKKDGVLALWQSRGFPENCKAIGDDDFECE